MNQLQEEITKFRSQGEWLDRCKNELINAQDKYDQAKQSVGALVVPSDAKVGESFCVWVRIHDKLERLLNVKVVAGDGMVGIAYEVWWRD